MKIFATLTLLVFFSSCASISKDNENWPITKIKEALNNRGGHYRCLGWYEMRGKNQDVKLDLLNNQDQLGCPKNVDLKYPGLFVSWDDQKEQETKVNLLIKMEIDESQPESEENSQLISLWEATLSSKHLETMGSIKIIPVKTTGLYDLELTYTLKPSNTSRPMRPGPPISKRYRFDGETYRIKK